MGLTVGLYPRTLECPLIIGLEEIVPTVFLENQGRSTIWLSLEMVHHEVVTLGSRSHRRQWQISNRFKSYSWVVDEQTMAPCSLLHIFIRCCARFVLTKILAIVPSHILSLDDATSLIAQLHSFQLHSVDSIPAAEYVPHDFDIFYVQMVTQYCSSALPASSNKQISLA